MKTLKTALALALCAVLLSLGCFASPGLFPASSHSLPDSSAEYPVPVVSGEVYEFTAEELERRLGMVKGSLGGATVTALPRQGELVLEGVEVEPYQFLSRAELDELCFVPPESGAAAMVALLPQGAESAPVYLAMTPLQAVNAPPVVRAESFRALANTRLTGSVSADDPDGDSIRIQVTSPPRKGEVTFDGKSFVYTPFLGETGADIFTFCAVDSLGGYSSEASVEIVIEPASVGFRYADMAGNPSEYAAFKLHEAGVISGEQIGISWLFRPDRQVTRGDFLVMALAAAGMDKALPPTVNTGLSGDASLPMWLKPYIAEAIDKGVWSAARAFRHNEIPTRAEAVQLTALAAGITDVKDFSLRTADVADIPLWALASYKDLAAYRMLDLHDGYAHPRAALDRAYAADLLWQLYKHKNRP